MSERATEWRYRVLDSPTGKFILTQSNMGELRTGWAAGWSDDPVDEAEWLYLLPGELVEDAKLLPDLAGRIERFFAGKVVSFENVPTPNGSAFQTACWEACRAIPRGETITYGELAEQAGSTVTAARAAGQSMRRNPLPIIVPCHRVVGSQGLHGFAGSDDPASDNVAVKQWLLAMEGAIPQPIVKTASPKQAELADFAAR